MTRKKTKKRQKGIDQVIQEELGISRQEFINLPWKQIIKLPTTFRGMMDGKEYLFEVKSRDEFYMTIPGVCSAEPIPKETGEKLLQAILKQQEELTGMPCEIDYGKDNHDNK